MRWTRPTAPLVILSLVAAACTGGASPEVSTVPLASTPPSTTTDAPATSIPPADGAGADQLPAPPDVDLSQHSVPLTDVYFDTFDGGAVPLSESSRELREALLDAIPPIDRPIYGEASAGDWLAPTDLVLGYLAGDVAYAYPFKILNFHEIVNDELDGIPVLITYCPLCGSGVVYDRRVNGEVFSFGNTSALYEADLVMVDRTTGSYWWQVAGTAIVGTLTGTSLDPLPSVVTTWSDWASQHPGTLILTRDTGHPAPYEQDSFAAYSDFLDAGRFPFPVGDDARDGRLPPSARVVGVVINGVARAFPVEGVVAPINDEVGGESIVVLPTEGGAGVFSSDLDGETLEFRLGETGVVDVQSGSSWNTDGRAVSGALEGSSLTPIPSRTTFWFAFVSAFPDVEVFSS